MVREYGRSRLATEKGGSDDRLERRLLNQFGRLIEDHGKIEHRGIRLITPLLPILQSIDADT